MKNKNVLVLCIVIAVIAAVGAAGYFATRSPAGEPPQQPAKAYVRVQVGYDVWPLIPLVDGGEHTVEQSSGAVNIIHTTQDSVWMHSSTCQNQDCVQQGTVSLDNRATRVLGSLIVCLPNEVILELLTPEEAGALEGGQP